MTEQTALLRYVEAQAKTYAVALQELQAGRKRSHWMWFIFPQLRGLGKSDMAYRYGVAGLEEAKAYLCHPVLGARLRECCAALLAHKGRRIEDILGELDAMKLRSSMTLFALASDDGGLFRAVLEAFFDGQADRRTIDMIENNKGGKQ